MVSKKSKQSTPAPESKGSGPKIKTREEHAAAKKAAKARQARNRNKAGAKQGTYYEETHGRNRDRSQEYAELNEFRAINQQRQYDLQATKAGQYVELTKLRSGSTARVMAEAMLRAFPDAQPFNRGTSMVSKTQVAKETALDELMKLDENHVGREGAIRKGVAVARAALNWAWNELH